MPNNESHRTEFPAIDVEQGEFRFYLSALRASEILPLCAGWGDGRDHAFLLPSEHLDEDSSAKFVNAIESSSFARTEMDRAEFEEEADKIVQSSYEEDKPFQRLIDMTRINKIGAYLRSEDALMPNPVILATSNETTVEVERNGSVSRIVLSWLGDKRPVNIIDGQHRIRALRKLIDDGQSEFGNFMIPFSLLIDVPYYMQAELFAIINGRQKAVNRSLIYDLLGYLPTVSNQSIRDRAYKGEVAVQRFCHKVVKVLNLSSKSPWQSLIKMRGAGTGVVSQAAFVDHLTLLVKPRSKRASMLPVLYDYFKDNDLVGLSKVCVIYFLGIRNAWPQYWENEETLKNCLFGKTNGIAVMFNVLHDLSILVGGPSQLSEELVKGYWEKAPEERITNPPAGGGREYQKEWYEAIMGDILDEESRLKLTEGLEKERTRLVQIGGLF
jgi:DGQHR domain-containing protein